MDDHRPVQTGHRIRLTGWLSFYTLLLANSAVSVSVCLVERAGERERYPAAASMPAASYLHLPVYGIYFYVILCLGVDLQKEPDRAWKQAGAPW